MHRICFAERITAVTQIPASHSMINFMTSPALSNIDAAIIGALSVGSRNLDTAELDGFA